MQSKLSPRGASWKRLKTAKNLLNLYVNILYYVHKNLLARLHTCIFEYLTFKYVSMIEKHAFYISQKFILSGICKTWISLKQEQLGFYSKQIFHLYTLCTHSCVYPLLWFVLMLLEFSLLCYPFLFLCSHSCVFAEKTYASTLSFFSLRFPW